MERERIGPDRAADALRRVIQISLPTEPRGGEPDFQGMALSVRGKIILVSILGQTLAAARASRDPRHAEAESGGSTDSPANRSRARSRFRTTW